jgi:hypothetical protein
MRFKVYNYQTEKAVKSQVDTTLGILKWGNNNAFPQDLIKKVQDSHCASAMLDTVARFVEGNGILNIESSKIIVEKTKTGNKTLDELHQNLATDTTYFKGVAILVKYKLDGSIGRLIHLPFENVRMCEPDDTGYVSKFKYNPYFGTKDFNDKMTNEYYAYTSDKNIVMQQILKHGKDFKGQIYYKIMESPQQRQYPFPFYYSGIEWFDADAQVAKFHANNIKNNFLLSTLIKMVGDPDELITEVIKNPDGSQTTREVGTVGDEFEEHMQGFSGAENAGSAMVLWAKNKDQFADITAFPTNSNHDLFITVQQLITDNIAISTQCPPTLAGVQVAGKLGNNQEIANSVALLNSKVKPFQFFLKRIYDELLPLMGYNGVYNIEPLGTDSFINIQR